MEINFPLEFSYAIRWLVEQVGLSVN